VNVGTVRPWQRFDGCCQERLSNVTISLLEDSGGVPGAVVASQVFTGQVPTNSFHDFTFTSRVVRPGGAGAIGTETLRGMDARYVRVVTADSGNPGDNNRFHIGEIRVLNPSGTNVALGASGGTLDGTPQHGLDSALTNGVADQGADTWSRDPIALGATRNAAAFVDLGSSQFVSTVEIYQRGDGCCQDRLRNFTLDILGSDGVPREIFSGSPQVPDNSFLSYPFSTEFTLEQGDVLQIELNAAANSGDLLRIGGSGQGDLNINPGVTLSVTNLGGSFSAGQQFNILDFVGVGGTFASVSLPGGAANWDQSTLYTTGVLTYVPEPSSLLLVSLGAACGLLGICRRKR
jgi:hypothetical protein